MRLSFWVCLDVGVIRVIGVFVRGDKVEKEEDWEAHKLNKCGKPLTVASFVVVEPPKESSHRLAGEHKE